MRRGPRATTRVAGVIGDPVRHSLSPVLHNAAFAALELDWVYVAFSVAAGDGPAAVAAMRALHLAGLSVTMPHKAAVAASVDRLTPVAERLAAVNTVVVTGAAGAGQLLGDSTDGDGFLDALRRDEGWDPAGRRAVVLGAGGAARAVCLALGRAGAAEVGVVARREEAAAAAASLGGRAGRAAPVQAAGDAELVVNATPVGMHASSVMHASGVDPGGEGSELPLGLSPEQLGSGQLVVDLVYEPPTTPLVAAARARGATALNGVGTLLHQAGRQVTAWTGQEPPLDAMSAALLGALAERQSRPPGA